MKQQFPKLLINLPYSLVDLHCYFQCIPSDKSELLSDDIHQRGKQEKITICDFWSPRQNSSDLALPSFSAKKDLASWEILENSLTCGTGSLSVKSVNPDNYRDKVSILDATNREPVRPVAVAVIVGIGAVERQAPGVDAIDRTAPIDAARALIEDRAIAAVAAARERQFKR